MYQQVKWSQVVFIQNKRTNKLYSNCHTSPLFQFGQISPLHVYVCVWGVLFSDFYTNHKDIGLVGVIVSKHVVCELLIAVKKELQAKTDL